MERANGSQDDNTDGMPTDPSTVLNGIDDKPVTRDISASWILLPGRAELGDSFIRVAELPGRQA